ncbi:MAG: AMP-binding protein, partial [Candidatus Omnitrophica bacterium]|nr:AMP-binding protein [Candidatus Omnitrophota bacterium]
LFDVREDDKIVNMFPFAPHLAFWQVVFGGLAANALVLSTGGGKALGTAGNISSIVKMQPAMILGVPSYVYHVLREAKDQGHQMPYIRRVVLGASRVTLGFKQKLAELLREMGARDVAILGTYGFTESRCAWGECPTSLDVSSGYHLYPDKEIFEIIDPKTGEVKGEGEDGEIVYTPLDAHGTPVLRFRTGDYVKGGITYEPCPYCQRRVPRLSSDITRLSDVKDLQLTKVKGALVNLNHLTEILSDLKDIDEWQLELCKKNDDPYEIDQLHVYVSPKGNCDTEQLSRQIRSQMVLASELTPNEIFYVTREEIIHRLGIEQENKEKRIVDRRKEM